MSAVRAVGVLGLCIIAVALVVLSSVPSPSALLLLRTSENAHQEAANEAAATAESLRRNSRQAESGVQLDTLTLSRDRTALQRLERQIAQDDASTQSTKQYSHLANSAKDEVITDALRLQRLEQRAANQVPHVQRAKERVQRDKAAVAADEAELRSQKHQRAALRLSEQKLRVQEALMMKRAMQLKQRSDRDFNLATTPGEASWNHYADKGAELATEAKRAKQAAARLESKADDAQINEGLVGGLHGSRKVENELARSEQQIRDAQGEYDRSTVRHGNLLEKIAAARTRLSAAQMQESSYERDDEVAKEAAKAMVQTRAQLRHQARDLKDKMDQLEEDIKDKRNAQAMLLRRANSEDQLSENQFKDLETDV